MKSTQVLPYKNKDFFSSQTAFKKPKPFLGCKFSSKKTHLHHTRTLENKSNMTEISLKTEDFELIKEKAVKKIKPNPHLVQSITADENPYKKPYLIKPTKLTIEEVFNCPKKSAQLNTANKINFFDEDLSEESCLSFMSSESSLDFLDEADKSEKSEMAIEEPEQSGYLQEFEPLFVRDNYFMNTSELNTQINQRDMCSPLINYQNLLLLHQYNGLATIDVASNFQGVPFEEIVWDQHLKIGNLSAYNQYNLVPQNVIQFPKLGLSQYALLSQNFQHSPQVKNKNNELEGEQRAKAYNNLDKNIKVNVASEEYGYDSDSNATKSTTFEQDILNNSTGKDIQNKDKSLKGSSSPYSISEESIEPEKFLEIRVKTPKSGEGEKKGRQRKDKPDHESKQKRKRSLNLRIDINPQHLKVERRLNKLQLLRYQKDGPEINKLAHVVDETANQLNNSLFNEDSIRIGDQSNNFFVEGFTAVIPPFKIERLQKRPLLKQVWNPEDPCAHTISDFMKRLEEILEIKITNEEMAIQLLKSFGMNVSMILKNVQENIWMYQEMFRIKIKVKRGRRRGIVL